ncbi:hypothetical protein [Microbacterium karelineae]|uniref:hypothetical protein n=1 Tax=Microbacterium karelineae TaxID=2654283 RepID=UPI0012EAE0EA|nr:hypothetical protein [Microbacterium karelineae]
MSLINVDSGDRDDLDPHDGWGDVPEADRPLWSRYMIDHLPWFPGAVIMAHLAPGLLNGNTHAPKTWKDTARALHAAGFTPAQYYLLAELLKSEFTRGTLDIRAHAHLFELWPHERRGPIQFRLNAHAWAPWLERVAAGESPRRALQHVLRGGHLPPLGGLLHPDGTLETIGD